MYGKRATTNHDVLNHKQVNILKISRWSVRQNGHSLKEALESFGANVAFLHYPQLQTTYVSLKANNRVKQFVGGLKLGGRVTVESIPDRSIFEREEELATPETTALITSESQFSEADIFAELKKYGSIRALLFTHSVGPQKWACKASFYEAYSMDQLLNIESPAQRTLKSGVKVRIERVTPNTPLQSNRAPSCQKKTVQAANVHSLRQAEQKQKPCITLKCLNSTQPRVSASAGGLSAAGSQARSQSQGDGPHRNKFACTFKDVSIQIENSLQIIKSRLNERRRLDAAINKGAAHAARTRSLSLDFQKLESREEVLLEISNGAVASPKDTGISSVYSFTLSELFFLQIKNPRDSPSVQRHLSKLAFASRKEEKWSRESYLSQDDLSDGYSAQEMYSPPQTKSGQKAVDIKHEASDLQKTKHSSDSEQSCDKRTKLASPGASFHNQNQFSLIQPNFYYRQMDALQPRSLNYFYYPDRVFSTS
jgi:hypothetical protein